MTSSDLVSDTVRTVALATAVSDTTSDAVIGHDADGLITAWNAAAERILGASAPEVLGTSFGRFFADRSPDQWQELLARARQGERVVLMSVDLRRDDGLVVTASGRLSPLHDVEGGFLGTVLVVHDRTEELVARQSLAAGEKQVRRGAEAMVRDALHVEQQVSDQLRHLDALKDDFLATVSHELRTPLTSIGGYAAVLAKMHPELIDLIRPIERNSAEMSRLVERLLDFCRLSAGQVVVRRQPIALARFVDECVPRMMERLPEIHNEIPSDLVLHADSDALRRILGNLLANAIRHAGPAGTVVVSVEPEESRATLICVADDGPGIAPIFLERLFERFYQVPGEAARRGTGIGLAIVREYVDQLGGSVWCDSAEGAGASFFLRLP